MGRHGTGVDVIEYDSAFPPGGTYDDIYFIRNPYQYILTERAMSLIRA